MSTLTYASLYGDESDVHGSGSFYFGALMCSVERAAILDTKLKAVKKSFGCTGHEMKWTKVSRKMLLAYSAFVQVFLDDPYSQFTVTEVIRDRTWTNWGKNEEERFFKSYYVFIRRNLRPYYYHYDIYLDYKSSKWYRWSSLRFAINNGLKKYYDHLKGRNFIDLQALNSKRNDLLQLVDVLLGAIRAKATAPPKTELSGYIHSRFGDLTRSKKPKFIIQSWTPKPTK